MAARIEEMDFGTKAITRKVFGALQREAPKVFDQLMFRYWQKVYSYAVREVKVDTGALRNTLRIMKSEDSPMGKYIVGTGDFISEYMLVAGGAGIINPKKGTEVDYARAHHDINPFLDRAIQLAEPDFEEFVAKYMNWFQKRWTQDQTLPSEWSVPLPVSEYQAGLEGRR